MTGATSWCCDEHPLREGALKKVHGEVVPSRNTRKIEGAARAHDSSSACIRVGGHEVRPSVM